MTNPAWFNVENFRLLSAPYALAIERGDYRRAAWIALRGIRRQASKAEEKLWTMRLQGCLKKRATST